MEAVSKSIVFGSAVDCDVRVTDDPYVSGHHAEAVRGPDGQVWVKDLGSMNGTWIDGNFGRIRVYGPTQLRPGDTLWLGLRTSIPWTPNDEGPPPPQP